MYTNCVTDIYLNIIQCNYTIILHNIHTHKYTSIYLHRYTHPYIPIYTYTYIHTHTARIYRKTQIILRHLYSCNDVNYYNQCQFHCVEDMF